MTRARARSALTAVIAITLVIGGLSVGSAAPARSTWALAGEARALDLALGGEGLTLGFALALADSAPSAAGVGAGQCELLPDEPDPEEVPCNDATTEQSSAPGNPGKPGETCAGVPIPAPLDTVLAIDIACGSSQSALSKGVATTTNEGKVGEITAELDVSGIIPQAEDLKEQLIDAIQDIIDEAPEEIENALDQLLDALDAGQGAQVILGPATSNVTSKGSVLQVESTAAGALVGVVGIPDLDKDGNPILGSSEATKDGLIIVEVGHALSSAAIDRTNAIAKAKASAALVTVKVRDITKLEPTYVEISVSPGQTVTILEGTPAESTITAAAAKTEEKAGMARAASDAVSLHLLKGIQGGLRLTLGRTTAAASVDVVRARPPEPTDKILPATGGRGLSILGIVLVVVAGAALVVRRRLRHFE